MSGPALRLRSPLFAPGDSARKAEKQPTLSAGTLKVVSSMPSGFSSRSVRKAS